MIDRKAMLKYELAQLKNIAKRVVNLSQQMDQGAVRLEYHYAMILSELYKDALAVMKEEVQDE